MHDKPPLSTMFVVGAIPVQLVKKGRHCWGRWYNTAEPRPLLGHGTCISAIHTDLGYLGYHRELASVSVV